MLAHCILLSVAVRSLRFQIGLLYTVLATVNIVFFSLMIFENQTDLLLDKFVLRSERLVETIQRDLGAANAEEQEGRLKQVLARYGVQQYVVFDSSGRLVWRQGPQPELDGEFVPDSWKLKALETAGRGGVFSLPYHLELRRDDFAADFILPLKSGPRQLYLKTSLVLREIQERLTKLYYQIAIAIVWGVIFHIAFAWFIARLFLRRLEMLNSASDRMAQGELSSRVDWNFERKDEIDAVGRTFNLMAEKVQHTIETITRLNLEVQNELEIGKEVQEKFLPDPAIIADLHPALYYRPYREVSGDLYSFYQIDENRRLIFFADATGHGIPAALLTAVAVMGLESVMSSVQDPAGVAIGLNRLLTQRVSREFFMTGVILVLEPNKASYVNAGHPPAFLIRSDQEVVLLEANAPPLGLVEDLPFPVKSFERRPGDRLLLYSDGLIETPDVEGVAWGIERFVDLLREFSARHPDNEDLVAAIAAEFERHTHESIDDVSMLLISL